MKLSKFTDSQIMGALKRVDVLELPSPMFATS